MPPHPRRSNVRRTNVTACMRCKSRKQRCDQNLPACGNCEAAGVDCVSVDIDGRVTPRSYIQSLEDRVAHLEKQLLAHGITDYDSPLPETPPSTSVAAAAAATAATESRSSVPLATGRAADVPLLLAGPLAHIAMSDPGSRGGHETDDERPFDALLTGMPYETHIDLPSSGAAAVLVDVYFEHSEFFSPIIARSDIDPVLASIQRDRAAFAAVLPEQKQRIMLVFAVATRLMNRRDASFPNSRSEAYYAAASRLLAGHPELLQKANVSHLQNIALLIQYNFFSANLSAAWYLLGLATRMAIELGLHNELGSSMTPGQTTSYHHGPALSDDRRNEHRWVFWAVCSFERILCTVLDRPCSLTDDAICTPLPDISDIRNSGRRVAVHFIQHRQILCEIHQTVSKGVWEAARLRDSSLWPLPGSNVPFDLCSWRTGIRQRLHEWLVTAPTNAITSSQLTPAEIFAGMVYNALILAYLPWPHPELRPPLTEQELGVLADAAVSAVSCYKICFRDGKLRFYWRTVRNLFRAGYALVHCASVLLSRDGERAGSSRFGGQTLGDLRASMHMCSAVLWGMVERHRPAERYRDAFDQLMSSAMPTSTDRGHTASESAAGRQPMMLTQPGLVESILELGNEDDYFEAFMT